MDWQAQSTSGLSGDGAAMVLAYEHPLATQDIDAFAAKGGLRLAELDAAAKVIAKQLDIEPDWRRRSFRPPII